MIAATVDRVDVGEDGRTCVELTLRHCSPEDLAELFRCAMRKRFVKLSHGGEGTGAPPTPPPLPPMMYQPTPGPKPAEVWAC